MTQKTADQFGATETEPSPPPSYIDSSPAVHFMNHEQLGGGRRYQSPPVELTPTRLRSNIKTTARDVSIVKEAAIRRQVYHFPQDYPSTQSTSTSSAHSGHAALASLMEGGAAHSNTSSLTLPHPNSRNPSPSLGSDCAVSSDASSLAVLHQHAHISSPVLSEPASGHPTQMNDLFFTSTMSVGAQSAWMGQTTSDTFDYMVDDSFPTTLLSDQIPLGTTASCGSESAWAGPSATNSIAPPLNLIPPTPLKDAASHSENAFTQAPSNQQLDLSYYPSDNPNQVRFPEESSIDHGTSESASQEPSLTGRRSSETNLVLEEGFAVIERSFLDLSKSTTMPIQQLINLYLKSHGRAVHTVNYWNVYANYFKDHMQQEIARAKEGEFNLNDGKGKGKGKESKSDILEAYGTPSE
jgi:hypothetical protein